jgi:hypothetical protein
MDRMKKTMVQKIRVEQHESNLNYEMNYGVIEGQAVPVPFMASVVVLLMFKVR